MLTESAVTLQYAVEQRDLWLRALEAAATGSSYSIGGRTLTRRDLTDINAQIGRWQDTIKTLELAAAGKVRPLAARASFAAPGSGSGGITPASLWTDWRT